MFEGGLWRPVTLGRHGEYLLSLTDDFETELADQVPYFDLKLDEPTMDPPIRDALDLTAYEKEEGAMTAGDHPALSEPGSRSVSNKHWKMFENAMTSEEKRANACITKELHQSQPRPRIV